MLFLLLLNIDVIIIDGIVIVIEGKCYCYFSHSCSYLELMLFKILKILLLSALDIVI